MPNRPNPGGSRLHAVEEAASRDHASPFSEGNEYVELKTFPWGNRMRCFPRAEPARLMKLGNAVRGIRRGPWHGVPGSVRFYREILETAAIAGEMRRGPCLPRASR